ncbi:MAG: hypothetical protein AAF525_03260 [Pseudomonadota bacterium]
MNSLEHDMYRNAPAIVSEQGTVWIRPLIRPLNVPVADVWKVVSTTTGLCRWWLSAYDQLQAYGTTGLPPYQLTLEVGGVPEC